MEPEEILIRHPRTEEYAACRMLLPMSGGSTGEYLLAVRNQRPSIVGAAHFVRGSQIMHGVRVHVIPPARRRGIGSGLIERLIEIARASKHAGIAATVDAIGEPQGEPFLLKHGFQHHGLLTTVETPVDTARAVLLPLAARLLERERRGGDRRIVKLSEAPLPAVTALYLQELVRNPLTAPWALLDQIAAPQFAGSPVFLHGSRVAGFMLFMVEGDMGTIPARIVAPEFQGGAINLLLMVDALSRSHEYSATRIQFDIPAENRDTESLARRLSARPVRTRNSYFRSLD